MTLVVFLYYCSYKNKNNLLCVQWSNHDVAWQIEAATCGGSSITSDVTGMCVVPPPPPPPTPLPPPLSSSPAPIDQEQLDSTLIAIAVVIPCVILLMIFLIIIGIVRRQR